MRLTVEEDRDTIQRYAHIKPAPVWTRTLCGVTCPGTTRKCTLKTQHRGPHVAHGAFQRVLAVWNVRSETGTVAKRPRNAVAPRVHREVWTGSLVGIVGGTVKRLFRALSSVEEAAMLILLLGFLWFAADWFLRILG